MLFDAREIPNGTTLEADLCIVGSGAAGITLANRLSGLPIKVLMLEGGGLKMEKASQALYEGRNLGHPYPELHTLRSRFFGGSTNCWGGWCRAFDESDFKVRDWVPDSGWPFTKEELEPYYAQAAAVCGLDEKVFRTDQPAQGSNGRPHGDRASISPPTIHGDQIGSMIAHISSTPRFGIEYRNTLKSSPNVLTYLHANALEIETNDYGSQVVSLRVGTLADTEFSVAARHYVLACGGIENPRLLLLSRKQQPTGLGNQHDLVGRYFMEHPHLRMSEFDATQQGESLNGYDPATSYLRSSNAMYIGLDQKTTQEKRLLNHGAWIYGKYSGKSPRGPKHLEDCTEASESHGLPTTLSIRVQLFGCRTWPRRLSIYETL